MAPNETDLSWSVCHCIASCFAIVFVRLCVSDSEWTSAIPQLVIDILFCLTFFNFYFWKTTAAGQWVVAASTRKSPEIVHFHWNHSVAHFIIFRKPFIIPQNRKVLQLDIVNPKCEAKLGQSYDEKTDHTYFILLHQSGDFEGLKLESVIVLPKYFVKLASAHPQRL